MEVDTLADNENSHSSNSSSDSSDDEEAVEESANIVELRQKILANPYSYDDHVKLLSLLREGPDLTKLREARENMANHFPLTESLWLEWFTDEMPLSAIPDQRSYIIALFERAVKDYLSVRIWIQYCQFMMDGIETSEGIGKVRDTFERAITAAGLHVTDGSAIWAGYRELEMSILQSYQQLQDSEDSADMENKIDAQIERVSVIFKRQLTLPLLGMEDTFSEFEDWSSNPILEDAKFAYDRALGKLKKLVPYEEKLTKPEGTKLDAFKEYIAFESSVGDPARIQCIFERAIVENCLDGQLWLQYTDYLTQKLKLKSVILPVFERSIRNCPWVPKIWQNYISSLERYGSNGDVVDSVFNQGLEAGFSQEQDYMELWMIYLGFWRRRVVDSKPDSDDAKKLNTQYTSAIKHMTTYFGETSPSVFKLSSYYATILDSYYKLHKEAIVVWDALAKAFSRNTVYWIKYTNALHNNNDIAHCRRMFQKSIQISVDEPNQLSEAYLDFEQMEGNLEQLEIAKQRVSVLLDRAARRQEKENEQKMTTEVEMAEKLERQKQNRSAKRAEKRRLGKSELHSDAINERKTNAGKRREMIAGNEFGGGNQTSRPSLKRSKERTMERNTDSEPVSKQSKMAEDNSRKEKTFPMEEDVVGAEKPERQFSVFLSNLLFSAEENAIRELFAPCGEIKDIVVIRNSLGRSKGYAYLEFASGEAVDAALKMDRHLLGGRPVFVSPDDSEKRFQFKFATSLDKTTVFVSNMPFEIKEDEIKELFGTVGSVKQVRLVSNRSGKSKGYGYVEFENDSNAATAVMKLDGHDLKGRTIQVALSNPPKRKTQHEFVKSKPPPQPAFASGVRGRAKTQVSLVPRSVHKPAKDSSTENSGAEEKNAKMSNADFRKLLGK